MIYIGDNQTSKIVAINLRGELLDWLDVSEAIEPGSLMGLAVDGDGAVWAVDASRNRVVRFSAK